MQSAGHAICDCIFITQMCVCACEFAGTSVHMYKGKGKEKPTAHSDLEQGQNHLVQSGFF